MCRRRVPPVLISEFRNVSDACSISGSTITVGPCILLAPPGPAAGGGKLRLLCHSSNHLLSSLAIGRAPPTRCRAVKPVGGSYSTRTWPIAATLAGRPAAKSGLIWPPGRSCGALSGRDVAPGTCRAGGLRLGPVGAAWHLPGPTIGLRGASDGPFRPAGPGTPGVQEADGCVWPPAGVGASGSAVA